jgi:RNA methyltransferase, TrmH family
MMIQSQHNPRFKLWLKLQHAKYRKLHGLFLVEGAHLVQEALKQGYVESVLIRESTIFDTSTESFELTHQLMDMLCVTQSKENVVAVCKIKQYELQLFKRTLICDRIQDLGNLGSLIRSAVAFGFDAVICSHEGADPHQDKVIRATQGAYFHVPIIRTKLLSYVENIKQHQIPVIGTGLEQATLMDDFKPSSQFALILGHEGQGVSSDLLARCDVVLKIDAPHFESLNVAVAGGILMHHLVKQVTN